MKPTLLDDEDHLSAAPLAALLRRLVDPRSRGSYRHDVPDALFEEIDHTADLAIEVRGHDLAELFARAGLALFAVMVERDGVVARERRTVAVSAADVEELLHAWLSQLLELFGCEGFVACEVAVTAISATQVQAELRGERFERGRHVYIREIKAVTYHGLQVINGEGEWRARVTFDV